jgi:conjugal transfer mating pair stabilization protein TraG
MDYVIYTYGGGEILWKIFNGLALFFQSDSAYLTGVVKLSMVIGGLWAALRAIYGGQMGILARDYFIPAYLILNIFLLPKTSVHIVDEVSSDFKYSKVDHIPIGIAAVTSTASKLSRFITDRIENSLKTAEATHFGKTGPMFAAKLVAMARDVRIIDPVERQNMKDFVRQCFTLPMVWTNILAGKKAALETDNILKLIAENPHSWLGSYWRTKGGDTEFLYCKAGVAKAKEILNAEVPNGLVGLATDLFGNNKMDGVKSSQKLKTYFDDGWHELSHHAASAHDVAAQEMMMNAYREGLDDKRQEFGLDRLNPHLVAYSSARARMQQNTGFLISSNLFSLVGPSLQSTLLGILCVLFVIVVPMNMLPGGLAAFGMWVKLILWVQSWPVFYAIINCVSMIIASGKAASYVKTGAGLSLLTQNGLADAAYDAYCYAEGFMCMVPVIAWAVISKSGQALSNLASTVTRGMDGITSKMGSELTDGNLSFDNQSFHNRSVANQQMAQQQLAPGFNFGTKYDDGRMNVTYDTHGNPIIQEAQTTLKTNVSGTDSLAASLSENAQAATTAGHNFSKASSEQLSQGLQKLYSYGNQYTKGHGVNSRFGKSHDVGEGREWRETRDIVQKFAQDNKISDDKAFQVLAHAGANSGFLKAFGIDAGINTEFSSNAATLSLIDKAKSSGLAEQFGRHLTSAYKHATGTDGSLSDQAQKNVLDSIQGNFSSAKNYQEQAQTNFSQADTYTKAASIAESSTLSTTTNWNDRILKGVAAERGETVQQTANWASENEDAYRQHAAQFMADKQATLIQSLRADHPLSEEAIRQKFDDVYGGKVQNTIGQSDINTVKETAAKNEMGTRDRQKMEGEFNTLRTQTDSAMKGTETKMDGHKSHIEKGYQDQEAAFNKRKEQGIFMPTAEKTPLVGNIGKEVSKPDDFGSGNSSYHTLKNPSVTSSEGNKPSSSSSITVEKLTPDNEAASSTTQKEMPSAGETGKTLNADGKATSGDVLERASTPSQAYEKERESSFNKSEQNSSLGTPYEASSFKEAMPGVQRDVQPSYAQMEKEINQHQVQNRVARQESQIRQLKDSIEMSKATPEQEEPFEIASSQTVER